MIQYQCRLVRNLGLWWGALQIQVHLTFSAPPSCRQHPSSLGIESYSHQETDVYPVARGFGPEWARRIRNCFRTTDGEWKPCRPKPVVISLEQIPPQEQPISLQLRKLTVRLLADVFNLRANELFGGTRNPLKHCWHGTRYNPVPLTKYPPDRSEGVVCDKGTDRHFIEIAR